MRVLATANRQGVDRRLSGRHSRPSNGTRPQVPPECHPRLESDFEPPHHRVGAGPADDRRSSSTRRTPAPSIRAPSWPPRGSTPWRSGARRTPSSTSCSPTSSALGAPLMTARFPRAYLDVNREPYELDPRMFDGRLPPFANTRSMRVAGGLGTIPRIVADGQEIYRGPAQRRRGPRGGSSGSTSPITGRCASSSTAPRAPSATRS